MPYIRVWIHLVWATKNRQPLITQPLRKNLHEHIRDNARAKGIYLDTINGWVEHIHCLICLKQNQTISDVARLLKGESSHWINKHHPMQEKFEWQDEYFAVSVSESMVEAVRQYICNQEEHHRLRTFQQEYEEFMQKYGFKLLKDKG